MQKTILNVIRLLLLICTICNAYITYLNLYPWVTGDYSAEIKFGTLGLMLLWFFLYCLMIHETPTNVNFLYQGEKRKLVFVLPLGIILMNTVLEITIYKVVFDKGLWIGDDILSKVICISYVLIIIAILFYVCIKNHIMIWCPVSLYCIIYALPIEDYGGQFSVIIYLAGAVIFAIIEYGIMLYLNRKKWCIPKDKQQNRE